MTTFSPFPVPSQEAMIRLQEWRHQSLTRNSVASALELKKDSGAAGPRRSASHLVWGVIPAAGIGLRAGLGIPKQYWRVHQGGHEGHKGPTVLERSVVALAALSRLKEFVGLLVVVSPEDRFWATEGLQESLRSRLGHDFPVLACPIGGPSRRDSVLAALDLLQNALGARAAHDWVMVHDAARPGLSSAALLRLWASVEGTEVGGLLAVPVPDTVKRQQAEDAGKALGLLESRGLDSGPRVAETLSRAGLWLAQTPQMFRLAALARALQQAPDATDESSAMEKIGLSPILVEGDVANRKLTFETDFSAMPSTESPSTESPVWPLLGQGFDVHALVEGRPLILGGVRIPYKTGLLGHSDADVLLHAICDALLGAAGLGDIGKHFPDTRAEYKNADSRVLLREVVAKIRALGLAPHQIDATIIAQAPKMAPHIPQMQAHIQADCGCTRVNVKATTTEHLGFTGREEGIACQALAVLVPATPAGAAPGESL